MIGKISLGINVILIAAVAYLFSQLGNSKVSEVDEKEGEIAQDTTIVEKELASALKIAYVLGDSINEKYKYLEDRRDELIRRSRRSDDKLRREMQSMEERYMELMQKQQSGGFTSQEEVLAAEQELQDRQMKLEEMQNEEAQNLSRYERNMQLEFFDRIQEFMEGYARENDIDMVVNIQEGGSVLYSNESNDVTSDVLRKLNEEYDEELATEKSE